MLPFVPNGRQQHDRLARRALRRARLRQGVSFIFSTSTTVFGPARSRRPSTRTPRSRAQRTLWGQQGSQVIIGNLLVVPIEDSLLYVQPLYLQSDQTQLPQLKRVIVFYRAPAPGRRPGQRQAGRRHGADAGRGARRRLRPELRPRQRVRRRHRRRAAARRRRRDDRRRAPAALSAAGARAHRARQQRVRRRAGRRCKAGDFAEYGRQIEALEQTLTRPAAPPAAVAVDERSGPARP